MIESSEGLIPKLGFLIILLLIAGNLFALIFKLSNANSQSYLPVSSYTSSQTISFKANLHKDLRSIDKGIGRTAHFGTAVILSTGKFIGHSFGFLVGAGVNSIYDTSSFIARSSGKAVSGVVYLANINNLITPAASASVEVIRPDSAFNPKPIAKAATPITQPKSPAIVQPAAPPVIASKPIVSFSDPYAWGNCTWWVFKLRAEINDPIPSNWGNATSWAERARADGYLVDHKPLPGAIMQLPYVDYGLGHVAFVTSVDPDGTWHISEMNVLGLDRVDTKDRPASAAASYNFIHDKI